MAKTLKAARNDTRVYMIDKIDTGYEIWLEEGYMFKDTTSIKKAKSIQEIWLLLDNDVILE